MRLLATGRDADVFDIGEGRVLRRYRDDTDVAAEAAVMARLEAVGFPVPTVYSASGTDLVMQRVEGPSLLAALCAGDTGVADGAASMVYLHRRLRETGILHLDLHPDNVLLGPDGPVLIDWSNSTEGPSELDTAMSALILAQVTVGGADLAALAGDLLRSFALEVDAVSELDRAVELRRANPTMTARELAELDAAAEWVRQVSSGPAS